MSGVPSLVEQQNVRLRLALEMIFREVVFNILATSPDEQRTIKRLQNRIESIWCNKVDSDEEDAKQEGTA
jgi:hypothetical protein